MNFDILLGLPFLFRDCHFHIVSALHFNISKFKISLRICLYTATLSPQNSNLQNFFITLSMILLCNFDANKAIYFLLASEAVARKCSVKKVFIKILQICKFCKIHRETPVLEAVLNKRIGLRRPTLLK